MFTFYAKNSSNPGAIDWRQVGKDYATRSEARLAATNFILANPGYRTSVRSLQANRRTNIQIEIAA